MTVVVLVAVAIAGGLASTILTPSRPRIAFAIGLLAGAIVFVLALRIRPDDAVSVGRAVVVASDALRTLAVAWAAGTLLLGLLDALTIASGVVLGPALIGLGVGAFALAVPDAAAGFAVLAGGGVAAVVVPAFRAGRPDTSDVGAPARALRIVLLASLLGFATVAWGASAAGPLSSPTIGLDPQAEAMIGLGLLGIVAAVVLRSGAIPAHVWAARYLEVVPATAIPPLLGWGSAAFALVALGWADATFAPSGASLGFERGIVAIVASACIVFGGVAAWLHEDVEHVLGYSLVQDAGVILLAFAWLSPAAAPAARDWAIAAAAVKTAFGAWVAASRWTFGVHRLPDLSGWAVRSPVLALGFCALGIAAVGLPGMTAFAARGALARGALPAPLDVVVLIAAFSPVVYLGRILLVGLGRPSGAVASAPSGRPDLRLHGTRGWTRGVSLSAGRLILGEIPALVAANRAPLAAVTVLGLAVLGLGVAIVGAGTAAG